MDKLRNAIRIILILAVLWALSSLLNCVGILTKKNDKRSILVLIDSSGSMYSPPPEKPNAPAISELAVSRVDELVSSLDPEKDRCEVVLYDRQAYTVLNHISNFDGATARVIGPHLKQFKTQFEANDSKLQQALKQLDSANNSTQKAELQKEIYKLKSSTDSHIVTDQKVALHTIQEWLKTEPKKTDFYVLILSDGGHDVDDADGAESKKMEGLTKDILKTKDLKHLKWYFCNRQNSKNVDKWFGGDRVPKFLRSTAPLTSEEFFKKL